jgi:hypothetical protein
MTLNITEPTVGASSGTWGQQLNDALTAIVAYVNGVEANAQPVDSDLTAIAALTTTAYGRSLLTQANAAAAQATLGLGSAATQASSAFDPAGAASTAQAAAISAAATDATTKANAAAAASQPLDSDLTAIAALTTTTFGRSFLALADAAAARTLLGLGSLATQSGTFSGTSSGTNTGDQDLSALAPKASPALTGTPTAPTQTANDNSTKLATTAYADTGDAARMPLPASPSAGQILRFDGTNWSAAGQVVIDAAAYGVKADNTTDDTAAIQAAIDAAASPALYSLTGNDQPAATVLLPRGRMVIKSPGLKLPPNVVLRGRGPANTYLVYNGSNGTANTDVAPGSTNAAILLKTGAEVQCEVRDLGIILNRSTFGTGDDGINFTQTGGASILGDTRHVIENVVIVGGRYSLILNGGTECRVRNVAAYRQNGGTYGCAWIAGTDHFFDSLTIAQPSSSTNGNSALRLQTSNTRFINCKVFGGGGTNAINDVGYRNQYVGCEVQDYNGTGMSVGESSVIGGTIDSCLVGLVCTLPSTSGTAFVRGLRVFNRAGGAYSMNYALDLGNGYNADIDIKVGYSGSNSPVAVTALFKNSPQTGAGNRVRINGDGGTTTQAAYAATYTPDPTVATRHYLATATGNVTIANPVSAAITNRFAYVGMEMEFVIPVDATGGYTLAFGTAYKLVGATAPAMGASTVVGIRFRYDGTNWRELGRSIT